MIKLGWYLKRNLYFQNPPGGQHLTGTLNQVLDRRDIIVGSRAYYVERACERKWDIDLRVLRSQISYVGTRGLFLSRSCAAFFLIYLALSLVSQKTHERERNSRLSADGRQYVRNSTWGQIRSCLILGSIHKVETNHNLQIGGSNPKFSDAPIISRLVRHRISLGPQILKDQRCWNVGNTKT